MNRVDTLLHTAYLSYRINLPLRIHNTVMYGWFANQSLFCRGVTDALAMSLRLDGEDQ